MEIRQIRAFLSVADTLHFGRSAKLLHLSQPALSLQIKALEDELKVKLLDRNRQGTSLTEAGRVFREEAVIALKQLEVASQKAQGTASGRLGRIRIGFISTAGQEIVPTLIRRFRKSYPGIEFTLRNILTSDQVGMIQDRTLDVGFLRLPIEEVKGIEVAIVHREPLVVVLRANHRLASGKEVRLCELRGEKFVMYERHFAPGFHDFLAGILSRAGVIPDVSQTASEMSTLVSLVDSGLGIAILPASSVKQRIAKIAICSIIDKVPPSEIGMIFAKQANAPAIENFCALAKTLFHI